MKFAFGRPTHTEVLLLSFLFAYTLVFSGIVLAWSGPSATAPGNNVAAPLNIGGTTQVKSGSLGVADFLANSVTVGATANASAITSPKYCIGSSCITTWPSSAQSQWTTSGSSIYYNTGNVGIGVASPSTKLAVTGEISSTNANAFRMVYGNYGSFFRNDGSDTYLLLTASGDQYGTWNTLRPFYVDDATGNVTIGTPLNAASSVTSPKYCISTSCITAWPSSGLGGSGTAAYLPKFTAATTLGNSLISDNGTTVVVHGTGNTTTWTFEGVGGAYGIYGQAPDTAIEGVTTGGTGGWAIEGIGNNTSSNGVYAQASNIPIEAKNTANSDYVYLGYSTYGIYSSAPSNYFSGNVGIGTASPSQKLTVGSAGSAANSFYDIGANTIGAGSSIYSYGYICVGNNAGSCQGTGGVVISTSGVTFPDGTKQTTAAASGVQGLTTVTGPTVEPVGTGQVVYSSVSCPAGYFLLACGNGAANMTVEAGARGGTCSLSESGNTHSEYNYTLQAAALCIK